MKVTVVRGDITAERVDAVVNPVSGAMRGGPGIDGAIHRAAGPSLLGECVQRFPNGLETGHAGWTPGFELPARWVIHTASPHYAAGENDPELLRSCYRRSLAIADDLGARAVAFPLISTGAHAWPAAEAVAIAVETILTAETILPAETPVEEVRLVAFSESLFTRSQAVLWSRRRPVAATRSVGELFDLPAPQTPTTAGNPPFGPLRGDAHLEVVVRGRLCATPVPDNAEAVRRMLVAEIERVVGHPLGAVPDGGDERFEHIPELNPGHGMSAGRVCLPWWDAVMIPSLLSRFTARAAGEAAPHAQWP